MGTGKRICKQKCSYVLFRPFLEAFENRCVAGLLTYFRYERLPNFRQWHKKNCPIRL